MVHSTKFVVFSNLPAHHNEMQAPATIVGARRQIIPQGTRGTLPERARCGEGGLPDF